jgi:hypothetical protein
MNSARQKAVKFAERMKRIPTKTQRCEVYGNATLIVDEVHAVNILCHQRLVARRATKGNSPAVRAALQVMQDRLDYERNPARGWRLA